MGPPVPNVHCLSPLHVFAKISPLQHNVDPSLSLNELYPLGQARNVNDSDPALDSFSNGSSSD